jgi:hypothetical protein
MRSERRLGVSVIEVAGIPEHIPSGQFNSPWIGVPPSTKISLEWLACIR